MGREVPSADSHCRGFVKFLPTPISGAYVIEPELLADERGFFARTYCGDEFTRHGLNPQLAQCSISHNLSRGTLRGMHFQANPHPEAKLVRCTLGSIFDVIVDLRPGSPTRRCWFSAELTAANARMMYVPEGCAHGFLTLCNNSQVFYQISTPYRPESSRGFRWNDPSVVIEWPEPPTVISPRDRELPLLAE
jgi:dTDP-4-dehydrorhamnose 3,5-epimerase